MDDEQSIPKQNFCLHSVGYNVTETFSENRYEFYLRSKHNNLRQFDRIWDFKGVKGILDLINSAN